ncbi:MAG: OFA family MFS transporter [Candidatus Lindowbacteria bacterium]|nr:OFA family MFS transporter [Candidatus Lindowbacteria bacterium]
MLIMSDDTEVKTSADFAAEHQSRWKYPLAGIMMMLCIGNVYSWSVFKNPLLEKGFTADQTTLAFQLSIVIFTIAMVFAGRWQDKSGPRPVAIFSGVMMGLGFILIKFFGHTSTGMIICFSGIAGIGMGAGYVTPLATAIKWYPEKRGLMSGLVVMGMGAGSIFGGMGGPLLITEFGVWNTFLIFGIVFGTIITGCGSILRNPPEGYLPPETSDSTGNSDAPSKTASAETTYDFSAKEMLATPSFYLLWLVFLIGTGGGLMVISQASNFGTDIVKLTAVVAGSVIMVLGIFNGLGRPACGSLSDKIGRRNVIFVAFAIQLVTLIFVLPNVGESYLMYAIGVSLMGFSYGGFLGTMPSITADYYGLKNVGLNYAWVYTGWGAAGYFGPQVAKQLVGGSIDPADWNKAFYFIAGSCVVGMVLWFFTKPPKRPKALN